MNRSCWLLGKGLSLGALRGVVWTVYQFWTVVTKLRGWYLKFIKMANEFGRGITTEIEQNFTGSWQLCSTPSFRFFEKYATGIFVSQNHIPSIANGNGNHKNLKNFYGANLVNYILESIQENLLTSPSAAKEVSARIDLLQAAQFIVDIWRRVSTETSRTASLIVLLNT
jgi:hypothetical protein